MRIGVIGRGKTGGEVVKILESEVAPSGFTLGGVYSRENPLTLHNAAAIDAFVAFVPAEAFREIAPVLASLGKPCVIGATGFGKEIGWLRELVPAQVAWVLGSNFSLGMNLVFGFTKIAARILDRHQWTARLREVHHTAKVDRPSGTALTLARLLEAEGWPVSIKDEREGDIKGIHELTLRTGSEEVSLYHEALDRKLFAEGALFALERWLCQPDTLAPGLHLFEDLIFTDMLISKAEEKK